MPLTQRSSLRTRPATPATLTLLLEISTFGTALIASGTTLEVFKVLLAQLAQLALSALLEQPAQLVR